MSTKPTYTVINADGHAVEARARKEAAIAYGEKLGVSFTVISSSGKVVHEHVVDAPTEAPAPEPEDAEEDLIGEPVDEQADEPEEADEEPESDDEDDQPKPGSKTFDVTSMKRKIAALLHKAERTDSEAERDALNAKAEKLMLRLGINQAELEAAGEAKAEKIVEERLHWKSVYAKNMVDFSHAVCSGIGNLTTLQQGRWADARVYIIGHKSDVELAVKLIRSLELQAFSAMKTWQKTNKAERAGMSNYDKLVGNRSFLMGFAATVANRLREERKEVETEASTGAALVLASKESRVKEAVAEMYPKLGKARGGNGRYSSQAAAAGRTAGATADIGNKRVDGGSKGQLK